MVRANIRHLEKISRLVRYLILTATTEAGSGHPSSSLSAVELMVTLFFSGIMRADLVNPKYANNDRVIFSKGHAAPLLYALYTAAGMISPEDLMNLRKFTSPLEGHPTPRFPYVEAATGSLGQGLSIGFGMALAAKLLDRLTFRTFVLLGDSEMTEGSNWEAMQLASYYELGNLIGIIDVNRLGQQGETIHGHDLDAYRRKISAFGWRTFTVDGHAIPEIYAGLSKASLNSRKPSMVIAKTVKGKGVALMEDRLGWHGKVLTRSELRQTLSKLGRIDRSLRAVVAPPRRIPARRRIRTKYRVRQPMPEYAIGDSIATRYAFGTGITRVARSNPHIVVLDAEVKNSTYSEIFERQYRERFFQMYIAEQNMVGAAIGLSSRGKLPVVSTFAAFLTRAFDQIRMASYSNVTIIFVGSHVGVSMGQDGPSQMGLEDISMFRAIHGSTVLYPCDAVSCENIIKEIVKLHGIVYLRTSRKSMPVIYSPNDSFPIGESKILRKSQQDQVAVITAGITVHEALEAHRILSQEGIFVRVIDCYSIKPIDKEMLKALAQEMRAILVVEDHHPEGGIAEAVRSALDEVLIPIHSLSVRKPEMSGSPEELLDYEDIAAVDIVSTVRQILASM